MMYPDASMRINILSVVAPTISMLMVERCSPPSIDCPPEMVPAGSPNDLQVIRNGGRPAWAYPSEAATR